MRQSRPPRVARTRSAIGALFLACGVGGAPLAQGIDGAELGDAVLFNGQILTVDDLGSIRSAVRIQGHTITALGDSVAALGPLDPTTKLIDLGGRTVVPGLTDTHVHFMRDAQAPGHRLHGVENAFTIPDLLAVIEERASSVPAGAFLALIGGIRAKQFAENRLPTLAEMDAAAPNHPVYLQQSFTGPAVTNSLGIAYFQSHSVTVNPNGTIPGSSQQALDALVGDLTAADTDRALREYIEYATSVGLTCVIDFGGSLSNVPSPAVSIPFDLWASGEMNIRYHKGVGANGPPVGGVYPIVPAMLAAVAELDALGGGDDTLDVDRTGEFIVGGFGSTTAPFADAFGQVAANGWGFSQHSISVAENQAHITAFETVNAVTPLAPLRWSLDHVFSITTTDLARLVALGIGVGAQNQQYFLSQGGPPYRDIVDSGVRAGGGTDGTMIAPLTPWASIYYMVTGRDVTSALINAGQTLTRMEALELSAKGGAWFTYDDDLIGSIEVGKRADLVVLSDGYLTIPDIEIRSLTSVLTVIQGETVFVDRAAFPTYGCGFNPTGSLTTLTGGPAIGTTWELGVDNPLGTQPPGSLAYLVFGRPDAAFPCGITLPGFGMASGGALGELLINLGGLTLYFGPSSWAGAGNPASIAVPVPNMPTLIGFEFACQGAILDIAGTSSVHLGLTNGVAFEFF